MQLRKSALVEWLTHFLVSNYNREFWLTMRALMNGAKDQDKPFFDTLLSLIDIVTSVIANRHGQQ